MNNAFVYIAKMQWCLQLTKHEYLSAESLLETKMKTKKEKKNKNKNVVNNRVRF